MALAGVELQTLVYGPDALTISNAFSKFLPIGHCNSYQPVLPDPKFEKSQGES